MRVWKGIKAFIKGGPEGQERAQGPSVETGGQGKDDPMPAEDRTIQEKGHRDMHKDKIKIDLLIHDLKVPIAVIEAGLHALLKRQEKYGTVTEHQRRVCERALRNTRVLQTLVNDALELGRSREGIINVSNFQISDLIGQALVEVFDLTDTGISEKIKNCTALPSFQEVLEPNGIHLRIAGKLWDQQIRQDQAKLRQILRNLLTNALKYRKKEVELIVDRSPNGAIIFSIKDDGEGIPANFHEKIFQCYFQMDAFQCGTVRGHGLGLAGVQVLVEDLKGQMSLESDRGQGARFQVTIPVMEDAPAGNAG